jgi:hypothetical protein
VSPGAQLFHLFQAVSSKAEAATCLIAIGIAPSVSLFRDFRGGGSQSQLGCAGQAGRRWRWKWQAQEPEDLDEDAPFYADKLIGLRSAYAVNHPVQGSSAEVVMIAIARLDKVLCDEPAQLIATVHDEAVLLVPDDVASVQRIGAIAQREMFAAFLEVFPDAPTLSLVDPAVGSTLGDLQPLQTWLAERTSEKQPMVA